MTPPLPPLPALPDVDGFAPSAEWAEWVLQHFVLSTGRFTDPEHQHLGFASIGWLLTSKRWVRRGRVVCATAALSKPPQGLYGWNRGRWEHQVREWFPVPVDFIVTLSTRFLETSDPATICAMVDHELCHCGQAKDELGAPRFNQTTGLPVWCIRGHDVEQFEGTVRRWGARAADVEGLVEAASSPPKFAEALGPAGCGICLGKAA